MRPVPHEGSSSAGSRSCAAASRSLLLCLVLLAAVVAPAAARQSTPQRPSGAPVPFSILVHAADTLVRLPAEFLLGADVHVRLDGRLLDPGRDYRLDARRGTIRLSDSVRAALSADTAAHSLEGTYRALGLSFREEYRKASPVLLGDSAGRAPGPATTTSSSGGRIAAPFSADDLFGSRLQKSGSIVRGLTIGSNRDLSLNSGFRMQLSGMIADDLELNAALTDENTPIQPEGTTQTLQEFDKVFVELKGRDVEATFGDFLLEARGGEFSRFRRKLQGARGSVRFRDGRNAVEASAAGAVARGKYASQEFRGKDGVQGPYRLTGRDNEREIVVIAGSERVYLDGAQLSRGENQDYVIDYATAEVTFMPRRLVSHASRIVIDFEYTDRRYTRSLVGADVAASFAGDRLALRAGIYRESDDQDAPIDDFLSDADRETLRVAGDDRARAAVPGAVLVGAGKGQYLRKDSLIAPPGGGPAVLTPIYVYAPFDTLQAVWAVTFSSVGTGKGDYEKVASGNFRFVGPGSGSYAPIRLLPMPESHALFDVGLTARADGGWSVSTEYARSAYDRNRFSRLGDDANDATAFTLTARFAPDRLRIGTADLGTIDAAFRARRVGARFASLDRVDDVEYARRWNIGDSAASADESLREGTLTYAPVPSLSLTGAAGRVARGGSFSANRYAAGVTAGKAGGVEASYRWELLDSRDDDRDDGGLWVRHGGAARRSVGPLTPSLEYRAEDLRSRSLARDTLGRSSFRFGELIPSLAVAAVGPLTARASFGLRWDDSLAAGRLVRASRTITQTYGWMLDSWNDITSTLDLALQRRTFTDEFRARNRDDRSNALVRWQGRYAPARGGVETDLYYEAASEQAARLERVFQRVPRGTGSYVYAGDLNRNNVVDEADFRQARFDGDFIAVTIPTDALVPVVGAKASARLRLVPSRFVDAGAWPGAVLAALSSESYFRVEERSSDPDTRAIYTLRPGHLRVDATTLNGSDLLTQDLFLFEGRREFSLRFRVNQRRGLVQYASVLERSYARERSVRLRWQFLGEIANQIDLSERVDNLAAAGPSARVRAVRGNAVVSDWSYRPVQAVEAGIRLEIARATNADTTVSDLNALAIRTVYSLQGKGQIRGELTREEVTLKREADTVPFELTGGRVRGISWLWRIGCDYRLTQFIQATLSYDGRSEGGGSPVHTARAEVRAFF